MTTKTIDDMLAELPPQPTNYSGSRLRRALAELALLKAAAEKRQAAGHASECPRISGEPNWHGIKRECTCGHDDMRKVLEKLK